MKPLNGLSVWIGRERWAQVRRGAARCDAEGHGEVRQGMEQIINEVPCNIHHWKKW
jgi:hypothetical protein